MNLPVWSRDERRRWETFTPERTVLAVARTYTSAVRLLEALTVFRQDTRVEVLFAFDDSSAFREGVDALLRDAGVRTVPWERTGGLSADLVLTASENATTEEEKAPLVVLPHGIGFHKYVPDSRGRRQRLSGVVPADRLRDRPVWMAISHPEQREQLLDLHPEAARRCVLIGDLAYDRMVASLDLRDRFRALLGVREGQRLVVVSSTWGPGSLLARHRSLPGRLLGALPADEYRVALVAHPNVWFWHGPHQVGLWLSDAFGAGLIRIPPDRGWQAALIAADVVVGDQGSVSLYGAALDRPFLLAAAEGPVVAGSPADELARIADGLDARTPLDVQVERALAAHRPGRFGELAGRMFDRRGQAAAVLRDFLYDLLALPVPAGEAVVSAVPDPCPQVETPRSHVVFSRVEEDGAVLVRRWPASVPVSTEPGAEVFRHLSVGDDEPDRRLPDNASVIVRRRSVAEAEASGWLAAALRRYSEAVLAVVALDGGCVAGLRDGTAVRVTGPFDDPGLAAAAVYTLLRLGRPAVGPLVIRTGTTDTAVTLELR